MRLYIDDAHFDRRANNTITGTLVAITPLGVMNYVQVETFNIPVDKIEGDFSDLVGRRVTVRLRAFVTEEGKQ